MSACPDNRCDGSGLLFDDDGRRARPCSCRPARMARKRAAVLEGRIPRRYRGVSFEREPLPDLERNAPFVVREVRDYVRNISERIAHGQGIWFTGDVGTGKTTLAMLISKAAMEANHTVAIYSLPRLLAVLRETFNDGTRFSLTEFIDRLTSVELLHVDDVGAEQTSDWVLEQLYTIVNTRYEDGRPMVLTTNLIESAEKPAFDPLTQKPRIDPLTRDVVMEPPDAPLVRQIGARTVSRLYEICGTPQMLFGADCRPRGDVDLSVVSPPLDAVGGGLRSDDARKPDEDTIWERAAPSRYGRPLD